MSFESNYIVQGGRKLLPPDWTEFRKQMLHSNLLTPQGRNDKYHFHSSCLRQASLIHLRTLLSRPCIHYVCCLSHCRSLESPAWVVSSLSLTNLPKGVCVGQLMKLLPGTPHPALKLPGHMCCLGFQPGFLLMRALGGGAGESWVFQLGLCHPGGRPRWFSWLLLGPGPALSAAGI